MFAFAWIVRVLLAVAAVVVEFFIAPTEPRFGLVQGIISLVVFASVVFALAFWPRSRDR
jgi:hypothetical protein